MRKSVRFVSWSGGTAALVLAALVLVPIPAAAAEAAKRICPLCATLQRPDVTYGEKARTSLARGFLNFTMGWTELIRQPAVETQEGHHVLTGIAKGASRSTARTLGGLAEMITFWLPKVNDEYLHLTDGCPLDTAPVTSSP